MTELIKEQLARAYSFLANHPVDATAEFGAWGVTIASARTNMFGARIVLGEDRLAWILAFSISFIMLACSYLASRTSSLRRRLLYLGVWLLGTILSAPSTGIGVTSFFVDLINESNSAQSRQDDWESNGKIIAQYVSGAGADIVGQEKLLDIKLANARTRTERNLVIGQKKKLDLSRRNLVKCILPPVPPAEKEKRDKVYENSQALMARAAAFLSPEFNKAHPVPILRPGESTKPPTDPKIVLKNEAMKLSGWFKIIMTIGFLLDFLPLSLVFARHHVRLKKQQPLARPKRESKNSKGIVGKLFIFNR
jgi:hypothetical protein